MNITPEFLADDAARSCPVCGAACTDDDRYCEDCGHDLDIAAANRVARWEIEITADREYFERMSAPGVTFPSVPVADSLTLAGGEVLIGRRLDEDVARIDMAGPPEDGGVSHRHAIITCRDDGVLTITDIGSTNGTFVNDSPDALAPGEPVILHDGDRIHVGAWTTIVACRSRRMP
jgi:hypothetical protein